MHFWDYEIILLTIAFLFLNDSSEGGYCTFPRWLWAALPDGSQRKWFTKTEHVSNTDIWERQKEIIVHRTEISFKHKVQASCSSEEDSNHKSGVPCYKQDITYEVICISEEAGDKYRVQQIGNGATMFTCLRFKFINNNIVQVFSAVPKDLNEDRLCYEQSLQREEWPWILSVQEQWSPCSLTGGYDFVSYNADKYKLCSSIWRPSRVESECIYGEGMQFFFPHGECNPFNSRGLARSVMCWGHWEEGNYIFIVLGDVNKAAQYILRYPKRVDLYEEFVAYLYFSPVAPLTNQGEPPGHLDFAELRLKSSDSSMCFDESERCIEFAQDGKCTNSPLHEYANYCRKSCGLCEHVSKPRPECRFPPEYIGEWILFGNDTKESVTIDSGEISFSHLGKFTCKSTHWSANRYKLISVFNNGCRPRYTCLHFTDSNEKILMYQLSRSRHTDESFRMCKFRDDPLPLGGRLRSSTKKVLLPTSQIHWGRCGLNGEIQIKADFHNGRTCKGILSDWNPRSCISRPKIIMAMEGCSQPVKEHLCIAHLNIYEDISILITQTQDGYRNYRCWVIESFHEGDYPPWKEGVMTSNSQCDFTQFNLMQSAKKNAVLSIQAFSDNVESPCAGNNNHILEYNHFDTSDSNHYEDTNYWPDSSSHEVLDDDSRRGLDKSEEEDYYYDIDAEGGGDYEEYQNTRKIPPILPRERKSNTAAICSRTYLSFHALLYIFCSNYLSLLPSCS